MSNTVQYCQILYNIVKYYQIMSNTVELRQILSISGILGHFCSFLTHFDIFSALWDMINIKLNNNYFLINFFDLNQIIYSFWFVSIPHYSTFYGESCKIIHWDLLCFALFCDSNHLFLFISIHFRIQAL